MSDKLWIEEKLGYFKITTKNPNGVINCLWEIENEVSEIISIEINDIVFPFRNIWELRYFSNGYQLSNDLNYDFNREWNTK
jgi:hypothetical protein